MFDQLSSKVSLTIDYQRLGYCVVTCHYIDDDWKLHKKIIAYQMLPPPHNGDVLSQVIKSQALAWNIDKKLFALTVDNASNNDVVVRNLNEWLLCKGVLALNGALFHMRCSAHILNLIVQDGLKIVGDLLEKNRESVNFTKSFQTRQKNFSNALSQTRLSMLESAIEVHSVFERLAELAPDYKCLQSRDEWEVGIVICDCLKVFYEITLHFSGVKYPIANLYFKGVCDVYHNIIQWESSEHDYVRAMACKMKTKFEKYWSICNLMMSIGVILNPQYKMTFIEYAFGMIYGGAAETYINKVGVSLKELYSTYEKHPGCSMDLFGNSFSSGVDLFGGGIASHGSSKMQEGFKKFIKERFANTHHVQKTELDKYVEADLFPLGEDEKNFDILLWWKYNGPKFPAIAKMALTY